MFSLVITDILNKIHDSAENNADQLEAIGVRNGILGLSLLNFCFGDLRKKLVYSSLGEKYLSESIGRLNDGYSYSTVYRELCELGYLIELLGTYKYIDVNTVELLNDIDEVLKDMIYEEMEKENFDPITGALGYGFYYLKRSKSKKEAKLIVEDLFLFIKRISYKNDHGLFWKSKLKNDDSIYLGITHGVAGIVIFLTEYVKNKGKYIDEAMEMILGACNFIRSQELQDHYLLLPTVVGENRKQTMYSKNYCYGDYSTLYGLYVGYETLGDEQGMKYCIENFVNVFYQGNRSPYLDAGFSLLYGRAGIAMLTRKLYQKSRDKRLYQIYKVIIKDITKNYVCESIYLGYKGYWNQELKHTNYSLNEGLIGIALELSVAYKNEDEGIHDEFYFLF